MILWTIFVLFAYIIKLGSYPELCFFSVPLHCPAFFSVSWVVSDFQLTVFSPPQVNFITEYMSSGSMKHFLKRTRVSKKKMAIDSWRRWCRQVLWALR